MASHIIHYKILGDLLFFLITIRSLFLLISTLTLKGVLLEEVRLRKSLKFWQVQLHSDMLSETMNLLSRSLASTKDLFREERRWV